MALYAIFSPPPPPVPPPPPRPPLRPVLCHVLRIVLRHQLMCFKNPFMQMKKQLFMCPHAYRSYWVSDPDGLAWHFEDCSVFLSIERLSRFYEGFFQDLWRGLLGFKDRVVDPLKDLRGFKYSWTFESIIRRILSGFLRFYETLTGFIGI